jgi:predicted TIM-barrel fold metal-dependent hydrolase
MVVAQPERRLGDKTKPAIIDCDVHNEYDSPKELYPFLSKSAIEHLETYGTRGPGGGTYPRFQSRRHDSHPPSGKKSGSDQAWLSKQLLDEWNVAYGILNQSTGAGRMLNQQFDAEYTRAVNDWQVASWLDPEPRLRASIAITFENAAHAVAEIERRASDKRFVQVQFSGRPQEPMGRSKYWPIYEAAAHYGLAVMSHAFGSHGNPITGTGWPSYYLEEHVGPAQAMQGNVTSMVVEGVFERWPTLNLVSAENGFGWMPALCWRLDSIYQSLASEVPHLKMPPSEYIRRNVWYCTQPMEEPEKPQHFHDLLEMYGDAVDRIVFATDYPHWDWDAPDQAFPVRVSPEIQRKLYYDNARRLYNLPDVES